MLHKKIIIGVVLGCGSIFFLAGCYKDKTVLVNKIDIITTPVSFARDIVPIFSQHCALSGCHSPGAQVPDLTPNNAYRTLKEENLIDVNNPANSEVMGWLTGTIKPAMPLGASTNPSNINALMLAWITQGANNN